MQLCILLYDDRVNTFHSMQEIEASIDEQTHRAPELVNLAVRNQQAHKELDSFNRTGKFMYVHKLTVNSKYIKTQREELKQLKEQKPEEFINEITNLNQNIRRIESNIRTKKYKDEAEFESWQNNLEKALAKRKIIIQLL